ncbi:hypothetical protein [Streptomyces sp. DSM 110735]|nr:hypothetical protein [Streptomyces sp. DSM 110735]
MPIDPYAILRALLRAEARRGTRPRPDSEAPQQPQRPPEGDRR